MNMDIDFKERMLEYYPTIVRNIREIKSIIDVEYPRIRGLHETKDNVMDNAYLYTMDESRITQWEKALSIVPLTDSTLEDRREVIIARMRGQSKLNTASINSIVNTFTGGYAKSWVKDNTLYVNILPSPTNREYKFVNVENELLRKLPAHMNLVVTRDYFTWDDLVQSGDTWETVASNYPTFEDILLDV